jgi:hypothetical protein
VGNGTGGPRKPSHEFDSWPPSAQEAYLGMKRAAKAAKRERDAVRAKRMYGRPQEPEAAAPVTGVHELTLPWGEWMDGKIHRLKKGKHFAGELLAAVEEAKLAARVSGKGILTLREQYGGKYEYLWVQFTDHAILVGDPCPCGGRKLDRLHTSLARCRRCEATMTLTPR